MLDKTKQKFIQMLCLVTVACLSACSVFGLRGFNGPAELNQLVLAATTDVNFQSPIAVDLVFVNDKKTAQVISNLRASEWFASKSDYLRQFSNGLKVHSWELVPGQTISVKDFDRITTDDFEILIFAKYKGTNTYRANITGLRKARVLLGNSDFVVRETKS